MSLNCQHLTECNGCYFKKENDTEQINIKKNTLNHLLLQSHLVFNQIHIEPIENKLRIRNRFDFTIENSNYGLYSHNLKQILDLKECQQISSELEQAFLEFKKIPLPIKKGSVRLRVSEDLKNKGLWFDFANLDIKNLLTQKTTFQNLIDLGFFIEIGQKGKSLEIKDGHFKLTDPKPLNWFKAYLQNQIEIPLNCLVSSFTQPSLLGAKALTNVLHRWLQKISMQSASDQKFKIAEFGAGIGQFTLPLLSYGHFVDVFEFDESSTDLLQQNANENNLAENLKIYCGDYQRKEIQSSYSKYDLSFVNPPRSGLKNFVYEIDKFKSDFCIYISCYPESLVSDLKTLCNLGYKIEEVNLVDQFPQTNHFETCVLLQRVNF